MITVPERIDFAKIPQVVDIPHLLEVQLASYERFLQRNVPMDKREVIGLESVFHSVFPVVSARGEFTLEYLGYSIGEPKYGVEECKERDLTFAAPLKAALRLVVRENQDGEQVIKDIIQSEVYLGEIPLITDMGTFIINGAERVIVSQLHRSPGVVFDDDYHPNGKRLFNARIIPYRGSWVEFTIDVNDIMYVYIDRRRKIPVTVLLKAMGFEPNSAIIKLFHRTEVVDLSGRSSKKDGGLVGRYVAEDVVSRETGEVILEAGKPIAETDIEKMKMSKVAKIVLVVKEGNLEEDVIIKTLDKDPTSNSEEALKRLYNLMRPGDPPNADTAKALLDRLFFNPKRYNLEKVGRHKMNRRLQIDVPMETSTLTEKDFVAVVANLIQLKELDGPVDDIDHLGNRRVRSVGELLANQFSVGLARMARIIRERMTIQETENPTPYDLVNARTISAVVQSFFGSSQLSQFMDQTNPLAELTHKRRLSALGPGGLTRERAGFEVRDVHYTHYGRMCPIETPEGPNIGLITSLATYARVNQYGFLETPYRKVKNGLVTDESEMLSADQEDNYVIAHANAKLDKHRKFVEPVVMARYRGDFVLVDPKEVHFMDVSPEPARERRRGSDPVPRARRREPGPHGMQHAAAGRASHQGRISARRDGPRGQGRLRFGRSRHRAARGQDRGRDREPDPHQLRRQEGRRGSRRFLRIRRRRRVQAHQVPAFQPGYLRQPEADRRGRAEGQEGRGDRGRLRDEERASSRSAATCSSPSCRGAGTTSRTRSSSARSSSRKTYSRRFISRSSRRRSATRRPAWRRSPARFRT